MLDKVKELIGQVNAFNATTKDEIETFRILLGREYEASICEQDNVFPLDPDGHVIWSPLTLDFHDLIRS